jgi:hypothetical protein
LVIRSKVARLPNHELNISQAFLSWTRGLTLAWDEVTLSGKLGYFS